MTTLIAIAGILLAGALQARMPTQWWLGGIRLEFLPALVVYMGLTLHRQRAIALALAAGMVQDALSAAPFGVSALAYGISAVLLTSLREVLDRDLPWVQYSAGALTSMAAAIMAFFVVGISFGAIFKMLIVASIGGVLTGILFLVFDYTRMVWGYE
jgi:rod shape-determining protein MreD